MMEIYYLSSSWNPTVTWPEKKWKEVTNYLYTEQKGLFRKWQFLSLSRNSQPPMEPEDWIIFTRAYHKTLYQAEEFNLSCHTLLL
jgi:hypothetical protein